MKQDDKKFQEKYVEFQILSGQLKQLQQQFLNVDQQILELTSLQTSLNKISEDNGNGDALIPLGAGIFLEGTIKNVKDAIITVGANVAVKKSVGETKSLVDKQVEEMKKVVAETEHQMEHLTEHLMVLKEELEKKE